MYIIFILIVIAIVILLIRKYHKCKKYYLAIFVAILSTFLMYTIFTYNGAVRLQLALDSRDVIGSYTTKIEQRTDGGGNLVTYDKNIKVFYATSDIYGYATGNILMYYGCEQVMGLKLCKGVGFF